ncbi:MAG TPA: right-handed parallel beta-helix repeat-containing protein, partial [Bacteroidales bacterium]|nr:right-handed parallel beta-helix repeat-containing protein [Bacteroidales bacterium]
MLKKLFQLKYATLMIASVLFMLKGCETLTGNLEANAGADISASVGETVTLDGAASTGTSVTMTYLWSFDMMPTGSFAIINDPTNATASFTPDVAGEYVITLIVSDGVNEDTDELIVMVTDDGGGGTVEVSGSIDSETVWEDHIEDPSIPDYRITGSLNINAILTVNPNVLIHINEGHAIEVNETGVLIAAGKQDSIITFTSSNSMSGQLWKGISISSTDIRNELSYAAVMYAGKSEFGAFDDFVDVKTAIALFEEGVLNLSNSTISNNDGYGIYLRYGKLLSFENNAFENNTGTAVGLNLPQAAMIDGNTTFSGNTRQVEIYGSSLKQNDAVNLTKLNGTAKYYVSGNLDIESEISIDPGSYFEMAEDIEIMVEDGGAFIADAAAGDGIVFTSAGVNSGLKWKGISFWSADARNTLSNVEISHAGNSEFGSFDDFVDVPANIAILEGGRVNIENSQISDGGGYGIYMRYGEILNFSSNTFSGNDRHALGLEANQIHVIDENTTFTGNGFDGVEVYGSTLSEESTWVDLNGEAKYHVTGNIDVKNGLNLDPGVDIFVDEDKFFEVFETGYFSALGTSVNMITINTSNESGQIYWGGLYFKSTDTRNALDYVTIS